MTRNHAVILLDNQVKTKDLVKNLMAGGFPAFQQLAGQNSAAFSQTQIELFIEEEELHDQKILTRDTPQSLKSMSSGERKKALLKHLLKSNPKTLVLVNPFDSLDVETQQRLIHQFNELSQKLTFVQITNRLSDTLPFIKHFYLFQGNRLKEFENKESLTKAWKNKNRVANKIVPQPLKGIPIHQENLVKFKNVSVSFNDKPELSKINWTIKKNEFWQLVGPNGSGKSTLLNLITGDSHKGYGQDLTLFGHKKGNGESVWELKKYIGYFSPAMVDRFKGYHSLEHMLISGLYDSIGLYTSPTVLERQKALEWLRFLGLEHKRSHYFHELSIGAKRLIMTARALIKHPPLVILDEPTVGLDDTSTSLFVNLVNAYASQSSSAIIYVSHRNEEGLQPNHTMDLIATLQGSVAKIG